jgi:hypothetical protein
VQKRASKRIPDKQVRPAKSLGLGSRSVFLLLTLATILFAFPQLSRALYGDDYVFLDFTRTKSLVAALGTPDPIGPFYRPLSEVVYFWIVGHLRSGLVFHLVNLLLVLGIGVSLSLTAALWNRKAGVIAAAVWSIHYCWEPTILWASGSQDLLATLASLAGIRLAWSRRWLESAVAILAALLAKETAIAAVPIVILITVRKASSRKHAVLAALPTVTGVLLWFFLWWPRFSTALKAAPSYVSLEPANVLYALLHLPQVLLGLEWGRGISYKPAVATLPAILLAAVAVWLAGSKEKTERVAAKDEQSPWWIASLWILLGAIPLTAVASTWSAYQYMFAVTGWACLVGGLERRLSVGRATAVVLAAAIVGWGEYGPKGFATEYP